MNRYRLLGDLTAGLVLAVLMVVVGAPQPSRASLIEALPAVMEAHLPAAAKDDLVLVAPQETTTLYAIADAYIHSTHPTLNYGSATTLYAGSQTGSDVGRALFRFNLASLPTDAIVDSAILQVAMTSTSISPPILDVGAYRIDVDWAEYSVNWANQPPVTSIGKSNGVGTKQQYYDWEVTGLAQAWIANSASNLGLELRSETEGSVGWRGFASREAAFEIQPRLAIQYHLPTCADLQEPNDAFSQAFLITPSVEYAGCIPTPSDLDYYRFEVDPATAIQVELYGLPANYDLYLYAPDQALLDSSTNSGTTPEIVGHATGSAGGQFYAKVQSGGGWDSSSAYGLKLTLTRDSIPPQIVSGPTVSSITSVSAAVSWDTDEVSDSAVRFGSKAGVFDGQAASSALTQVHLVMLTGLQPSTTYRYVISSTDAAGNVASSREAFFTTEPVSGTSPPVVSGVTLTRLPGDLVYYNVAASVPVGADVERVEFYMDGEPIGSSYAPLPGAPPGVFEFPLVPAVMDISRAAFFTQHTIEAIAVGRSGLTDRFPVLFDPPYECAEIDSWMVRPDPDTTLYIDDSVLPTGTLILIEVSASQIEPDCELCLAGQRMPYECRHCIASEQAVERVEFAIAGRHVETLPGNDENQYVYWWDASGLGPGTYGIRVDAIVSDDCKETLMREVTVAVGQPRLDVTREVARHGNYFEVELTIENRGHGSIDITEVKDQVTGFQPIARRDNAGRYEVTTDCQPEGRRCEVEIELWSFLGFPVVRLAPGERLSMSYQAVPILYPSPVQAGYAIGSEPVRVSVVGELVAPAFDRPCVQTTNREDLAAEVAAAQAAADYLIISSVSRLFSLYDHSDVNALLSAMAELAQLKNGILGDIVAVGDPSAREVRQIVLEWGQEMQGSGGEDGEYRSSGYLLIVGEQEVIGSFTEAFRDPWPWHPDTGVHSSDLRYGNTGGAWAHPELSVGRIVGDDAARLLIPLQTSINVAKGEPGFLFDRTHALVVAGRGEGVTQFEADADAIRAVLDDEFWEVVEHKQRDVEDRGGNINALFMQDVEDRDVVFYRDHCNEFAWADGSTVVDTGDFHGVTWRGFGSARPFVFACCCEAGRYDSPRAPNIVDEFLEHGAGAYIGATEVSQRSENSVACLDFYDRWVGSTIPIGRALRNVKRHLDGFWETIWAAEYNLYGDPKYGGEWAVGLDASTAAAIPPSASVEVTVPEYVVTPVEDQDRVRIPGGSLVLRVGQPEVPTYSTEWIYPAGYEVQDVILIDRGGLVTGTGLQIPNHVLEWDAPGPTREPAADGEDWWPQEAFDWSIDGMPDGTSVLTLQIYPFYYNPLTTDFLFYRNYSFEVWHTTSTLEIVALTTDKSAYAQGEAVQVGLWMTHTGVPQDAVISAVIRSDSSGEVVDGLPLRTLEQMGAFASVTLHWGSAGFAPGGYTIAIEVRGVDGNVLARAEHGLRLGLAAGEIGSFAVTPASFEPGETVGVSLTFSNTGSIPLTGTAVVQIQSGEGALVKSFSHDYVSLSPGHGITFDDAWDTTETARGDYRVVAYVLYDSTATEPRVAVLETPYPLYLPLVSRRSG